MARVTISPGDCPHAFCRLVRQLVGPGAAPCRSASDEADDLPGCDSPGNDPDSSLAAIGEGQAMVLANRMFEERDQV